MDSRPTEAALIARALAAIEQVLARSTAHGADAVPFWGPTDLGALPADDQHAVREREWQSYRAKPEHSARCLCLEAASALLDVSQMLVNLPPNPSPREREEQWSQLINHTKYAGRAAYRAALILTDTKSQ